MATVQYQEGMAVFIRDGVAVDPWGREVEGYEIKEAPATPTEAERDDDRYDEMSANELKDELKRRQEIGHDIDITSVRRKADLAQKLREDDAAHAQDQQS